LAVAPAHLFLLAALGHDLPTLATHEPRVTDGAIARAIALACGT
jgi:hypothetical protein